MRGRTALVVTVLFGLLTTAVFALVVAAAASTGMTPNYCLHHVLVP